MIRATSELTPSKQLPTGSERTPCQANITMARPSGTTEARGKVPRTGGNGAGRLGCDLSVRMGFQHANERLQSRRHLVPAWIIEEKSHRARPPVLEQTHQLLARNMRGNKHSRYAGYP